MTNVRQSGPRAVYRCGMCSGRVRVESATWVECAGDCCWSASDPERPPLYRLRVALTVPGRTWWTVHGWPAHAWGKLFGPFYRPLMGLRHRFGWHAWKESWPDGERRSRCTWCGVRR